MKRKSECIAVILTVMLVMASCGAGEKAAQNVAQESTREGAVSESQEEAPDAGVEENAPEDAEESDKEDISAQDEARAAQKEAAAQADIRPAIDFTLQDQYGVTHTLSDYEGKVVFLNFWATWCPPCRAEMPDIQKLYEEYAAQTDAEVVILGIAAPGSVDDQDLEGVKSFLSDNGYTYPVVMDMTGEIFNRYIIMAYPTTYMIDKEGNIYGYVQGMMEEEVMRQIIDRTLNGA